MKEKKDILKPSAAEKTGKATKRKLSLEERIAVVKEQLDRQKELRKEKTEIKLKTIRRKYSKVHNKEEKLVRKLVPEASEPQRLLLWHDQALLLVLDGKSPKDICEIVGKSRRALTKLLSSELGKNRITELRDMLTMGQIKEHYQVLSNDALQIIKDALKDGSEEFKKERLGLALKIWEIAGLRKPDETKITHTHIYDSVRTAIENVDAKRKQRAIDSQDKNTEESIEPIGNC